jgi:hypothetical protein
LNVFENPESGGSYDFEIIKELAFQKISKQKNQKNKITRGSLNSKIKEILESEVINKI